jgi:PAS domain S-box-containing protein
MQASVSRRLLGITVGVTSLAVTLAGGVLLRQHRRELMRGLESSTVILARTVSEHCVLPLFFDDQLGAGEILAKLERSEVVGRAVLYDRSGRAIATYQRPGSSPPAVGLRAAPALEHAGGFLHVFEPVLHRGTRQGTLYLAASSGAIRGETREDLVMVLLAGLAATSVAAALAWMLQRSVTRPILRLAETMRGITGETMLTTRVEHGGRDELGVLYGGFNRMLDQLAAQTAERDRSEGRLRALIAALPDPVFVLDDGGRIAEVLAGRPELPALSAADLRGKQIAEVTAPDRAEHFADAITRALSTGTPQRIAYERDDQSASKHWFDAVLVPIAPGAQGQRRKPLVLFVPRDVTERHTLELDLRQLQKMDALGRLAGGVAHDFNNILTAIMGYGSLLVDRLKDEHDDAAAEAEEILKASERAALLTQQLLAFSRRQVVAPRRVSLTDLVGDMQRMLERIIGEDVHLIADLAPGLAAVHVDPGQIQQVILNLAVNAREAMPGGGTLTLRTRPLRVTTRRAGGPELAPGRYILFEVTDTGVGMDEAVRARIFEPFFTTKGRKGGTGLGLAMVYGIVRQASGAVAVSSELNRGTTFRIFLPEAPEGADIVPPRAMHQALPRGNETLLVVEDEPQLLELTCRMLREQGYDVMGAPDAQQALQICAVRPGTIHMLVTDIVMPRMSGTELAQAVRPLRPDMKVLFMSGYTDSSNVQYGGPFEHTAFLQKPFTADELCHAVHAALAVGTAATNGAAAHEHPAEALDGDPHLSR